MEGQKFENFVDKTEPLLSRKLEKEAQVAKLEEWIRNLELQKANDGKVDAELDSLKAELRKIQDEV